MPQKKKERKEGRDETEKRNCTRQVGQKRNNYC